MTFPLRATQFFQGTITSTSYVSVYTVPTGHRIILKNVHARNRSGSTNGAYCRVSTGTELVHFNVGGSSFGDWNGWIVLNAGQVLQLAVDLSAGQDFTLSGTIHYI